MDALEAILSRRSIRKYTDRPVPEETVKELLKAAMSAPSANNVQPWEFVVITERKLLDAIPEVHPYSKMLKEAPLAIVVCGDSQKQERYWPQDCAAATQNILVAARALGLGAVWLGVYPRDDRVAGLAKLLGIPGPFVPLCVISIGYPAEEKPPSNRYDEAKIHRNGW